MHMQVNPFQPRTPSAFQAIKIILNNHENLALPIIEIWFSESNYWSLQVLLHYSR